MYILGYIVSKLFLPPLTNKAISSIDSLSLEGNCETSTRKDQLDSLPILLYASDEPKLGFHKYPTNGVRYRMCHEVRHRACHKMNVRMCQGLRIASRSVSWNESRIMSFFCKISKTILKNCKFLGIYPPKERFLRSLSKGSLLFEYYLSLYVIVGFFWFSP